MRILSACLLSALASVCHANGPVNPVTRVVSLLNDLSKRVEKDGTAEAKLFKKFRCWCDDVEKRKTEAIAAANARISELQVVIDDLVNGRVTLTSESDDLNKQLEDVRASMSAASEHRNKSRDAYTTNMAEFNQAITALNTTIGVMGDATKPSLLNVGSSASHALRHTLLTAKFDLRGAIRLGQGLVDDASIRQMEDFIDSPKALDVPKPDWAKMNKNSPAAQKYAIGSTKIQQTMKEMLAAFTKEVAEATQKESDDQTTYDELMTVQQEQEQNILEALNAHSLENAARAKKVSVSKAEKSDLETQVADDTAILNDSRSLCTTKTTEYEERVDIRNQELEAISKAINMIHSDDARDIMSKSHHNHLAKIAEIQVTMKLRNLQGEKKSAFVVPHSSSPVAMAAPRHMPQRVVLSGADEQFRKGAVEILKRAAAESHSPRIAALAHNLEYLDASVPDVAALLSTSNSTETEGAVDEVKIGGFQVTQGIPRPRRDEEEGEAKTAQKVEEASDKKEVRTGAVKKSTETAQPLTSRTANYTGSVLTTIQTFIRKRIQALKEQEKSEYDQKAWCVNQTAATEASLQLLNHDIEDLTSAIEDKTAQRAEVAQQIADVDAQVDALDASVAKAAEIRQAEQKQFNITTQDDRNALSLLDQAVRILSAFYDKNSATTAPSREAEFGAAAELLQVVAYRRRSLVARLVAAPHKSHIQAAHGGDVPPVPTLWTSPYQGRMSEGGGVTSALTMIMDDLNEDIATATKEEQDAVSRFEKFEADAKADKENLLKQRTELETQDDDLAKAITLDVSNRDADQKQVETSQDYLKSIQPGCDFLIGNFADREKALVAERDGLEKALASLNGADFDKFYKDPSRELKPGDSL